MKKALEAFLVKILPATLYRTIGAIYGLIQRPKLSYSQYGEDLIIESFFKKLGLKEGVYLDIGAFHPKWLSNTHKLSKAGWSGGLVDIDNHKIRLFELMRRNCNGFIAAVAPGKGGESLPVYRFRRLWSEIDTLSLEDAQRYEKTFGIRFDQAQIKTISINDVLKQTTEKYGKVNFINIDIEGLDEAIIFEMDFNLYLPELICFENNLNFSGSERLKELFQKLGYQHLFSSGGTHGYFHAPGLKL